MTIGDRDEGRVMGMVDRDDVAVAGEIDDQTAVKLALYTESGREETGRNPALEANLIRRPPFREPRKA